MQKTTLSFDQLPCAIHQIGERLDSMELLLSALLNGTQPTATKAPDDYVGVKDAASILNVSQQTVYQNIRKIPHVKRFGKLYFKRSELIAYLEEGATLNKKGGKQ
ncbi:helix-turn-helix domain-containing protein [Telluribacter sp. SYSU D00476]|uniref:helix-turn-helix domain-containing protein n=1 Tax=Telluribacter sp. SYSU D00476 TaxID=2811430 RepID=UPI001FF1D951|nr:helix-turn-helix domain-containing protein [Telluribacter sp. SYSU D00476]